MPLDAVYDSIGTLLSFDGVNGATSFVDEGPNALVNTFNGTAQLSNLQSRFGSTSLLLDGTATSNVSIPTNDFLNPGKSGFTIEADIYFNALTGFPAVCSSYGASGQRAFVFFYNDTAKTLELIVTQNGATLNSLIVSWVPSTGVWYHVGATVGNSSEKASSMRLWIDGNQVASKAYGTSIPPVTANFIIGNILNGGNEFNGHIANFRFTRGIQRLGTGATSPLPTGKYATSIDPNLIRDSFSIINPGAETGDITGWTNATGTFSANSGAAHVGSWSFWGGNSALSEGTQVIAVDVGFEDAIDSGGVEAYINDYEAGDGGDDSVLGYEWLDSLSAPIGARVNAIQFTTVVSLWHFNRLKASVPPNARFLKIYLASHRSQGINNDGRFDSLTAELRRFVDTRRVLINML